MPKTSTVTKKHPTSASRLPAAAQPGSIYARLREELRVSVLQVGQPGDRVPSERQLAQLFGVSPITVSRALQELQNEGSIERIVGKGTFISKVPLTKEPEARVEVPLSSSSLSVLPWEWQGAPNLGGMNLAAPTPYIWIVASMGPLDAEPLNHEFWPHRLSSHVERCVQKLGGRTVLTNLDAVAPQDVAVSVEKMLATGVNGVVFVADIPSAAHKRWMHRFLQGQQGSHGVAVTQVCFGNRPRFPVDSVRFSGEHGAFEATSHLLSLGHREIAFLSPPPETEWVGDRIRGFWRALEMAGHSVPEELEPSVSDERIIFGSASLANGEEPWEQAGREAGEVLLSRKRFTGLVAANDAVARGFIQLARERGKEIPRDFSVVGFDDRHYSSTLGLSTLHPPIEAMGESAAALVLRRLAQPFEQGHVEVVLDSTLVVRSSTQPPLA